MLIDECRKAAILALVGFNLDFELLSLLGELFRKRLEFEELHSVSLEVKECMRLYAYLLLPTLQFFHQEVIPLVDLGKFGVQTTLEIDVVLPRLKSIPRILVALSHNFIQVPHRYLGHQRFLDGSTK